MTAADASTEALIEIAPNMVNKPARHVRRMVRFLLFLLSLSALGSLVMIFINFNHTQNVKPIDPQFLIFLVIGNLVVLVTLAIYVVRRAYQLWHAARLGLLGTRLQTRIIATFAMVTIVPTLIVTLFAALFFNFGVKAWFDNRVAVSLQESVMLAQAYLDEHRNTMRQEAQGMVNDLSHDLPMLESNPQSFDRALNAQANLRNLSEAIVFTPTRVLARTALSFSLTFERLPDVVLERANEGNIVVLGSDNEDKIRAVIKFPGLSDIYLMIGRVVDSAVINHMKQSRSTMEEYSTLKHDIRSLQLQFILAFILLALLLLLASVWAGMAIALRVVGPVSMLIAAADRVRSGDYSIRVPEGREDDEIASLGRSFNRMTMQLDTQRRDLTDANRLLDERRRLTEAVFSGVSAGIIALNPEKKVTLHNRTALKLLGKAEDESLQESEITLLLPALSELLQLAEKNPKKITARDIVINRAEIHATLHVRITVEQYKDRIEGFIITLDDITTLVSAQRSAAWADVARRVAHEIKNPLTPITLSAERLRKKFSEEITSDKEAYSKYLDTIARHVKDIGNMVEEFVTFARMPAAQFSTVSMTQLVKKSIFSEQTVHPEIRYKTELSKEDILMHCDERQIGQILLNLLKNAAESIETRTQISAWPHGEITLILSESDNTITVEIRDNGIGFPEDKLPLLTEPYVTTRAKGTGLGLAIVKKSMEEHHGTLQLANDKNGGAVVTMQFPKSL